MFCSWVEGGEGVKTAEREDMVKEERGGRRRAIMEETDKGRDGEDKG